MEKENIKTLMEMGSELSSLKDRIKGTLVSLGYPTDMYNTDTVNPFKVESSELKILYRDIPKEMQLLLRGSITRKHVFIPIKTRDKDQKMGVSPTHGLKLMLYHYSEDTPFEEFHSFNDKTHVLRYSTKGVNEIDFTPLIGKACVDQTILQQFFVKLRELGVLLKKYPVERDEKFEIPIDEVFKITHVDFAPTRYGDSGHTANIMVVHRINGTEECDITEIFSNVIHLENYWSNGYAARPLIEEFKFLLEYWDAALNYKKAYGEFKKGRKKAYEDYFQLLTAVTKPIKLLLRLEV